MSISNHTLLALGAGMPNPSPRGQWKPKSLHTRSGQSYDVRLLIVVLDLIDVLCRQVVVPLRRVFLFFEGVTILIENKPLLWASPKTHAESRCTRHKRLSLALDDWIVFGTTSSGRRSAFR